MGICQCNKVENNEFEFQVNKTEKRNDLKTDEGKVFMNKARNRSW
jgi:hypothetical protein